MKFSNLYKMFFLIFLLSFVSSILFPMFISRNDVMAWKAFSVFMPVCTISLILGVIFLIIDKFKSKYVNEELFMRLFAYSNKIYFHFN